MGVLKKDAFINLVIMILVNVNVNHMLLEPNVINVRMDTLVGLIVNVRSLYLMEYMNTT